MLILTLLNAVIVFGQEDDVIYADDIWLSYNRDEIRLYYNEGESFYQSLDIYYKVLPEDVTDNTVFVTLTDESVATIEYGDDYFTVTAKKEGRAGLFVSSSDGRVTKSFNVIVEESQTRVEDFNIIDDYIELSLNEVKDISYEIYPENAFNKNVHWCFQEKSEVGAECISVEDDKSVVEVFRDVNGRVKLKGVGKGVVNLVGITEDKGYNDNVIIVVDGGQIPGVEPLEDVEIIPHKDDILVGDSINLMYKVTPLNGDVSDLIWYSENPDVLEVYPNGYAIAKASGTVRVGVKSNRYNVEDTLEIKVLSSSPIIYATNIVTMYDDISLYKGQNILLSYRVEPDNVTIKGIDYIVDNPNIIDVVNITDELIYIKAIGDGNAILYLRSKDGRVTKGINIEVKDYLDVIYVQGIDIQEDDITLSVGEVRDINYEITPSDATFKDVEWYFKDEKGELVPVSENRGIVEVFGGTQGRIKVKGIREGEVTLVGVTVDGDFKDTVKIRVDKGDLPSTEPLEDLEIIINKTDIVVGDNFNLVYKTTPLNGDVEGLVWYSNDPNILDVYPNGYAVAKSAGVVEIGITSVKYGIRKSVEVEVLESAPIVYVTDIVTLYNDITLYKGQNMYLDYIIKPENATDKGVRCISLNTGVVRVIDDRLCQITAVKEGEAFIDIISNDYRARSTIKVIVEDPSKDDNKKDDNDIRDIYFLKSKETIEVDETKQLRVFSIPFRPTIDNLYFYSSDYDIVDVDDKGVIKGVSRGRAVVTAITADGLTDRVAVEVNEKEVLPKDLSIKVGDKYQDDKVDKIELNMGDSKYLQPVFQPADTTFTDIIWKTSDSKVVSINNNGLMKAVGPGEATITAQVRGTTLEVKLNVKVNYSESYWLTIDQGIADGDRDFIVIFSMNIRDIKSNKEKIYITTDPTGNSKDSLVEPVINNNEVVFKVPKQGWSRGEDYYIFIEEGVESVNGDLIKKGVRYKFKIRGAL